MTHKIIATRESILEWRREAKEDGAEELLIVRDAIGDYPVSLMYGEDLLEVEKRYSHVVEIFFFPTPSKMGEELDRQQFEVDVDKIIGVITALAIIAVLTAVWVIGGR